MVPQFSCRKWRYSRAANVIARNRNTAAARLLTKTAHAWLDASENVQFAMDTNGEAELLRRLSPFRMSVIFDVGANIGDWAVTAAQALRQSHIHCFELDEESRSHLKSRRASEPDRFTIAPSGLDQESGHVAYDFYPAESALTSIIPIPHSSPSERRSSPVITGDEYVEMARIDAIDLLKIDVEGAEGRVLEGFSSTLREGKLRVIQFEYGLANVVARWLLADMYETLERNNFSIGRVFPDGVEFRPYNLTLESFRGGNFVAVHAGGAQLAKAIAVPTRR
jgi:FkbM family methyltransferase